jgi:hypothetical protein
MGINPESREGELSHIGSPDRDESRSAQPRYGRRVAYCRGRVAQYDRAGSGYLAGDIEQILDRDWNAGERRWRRAVRPKTVVIVRRGERARGVDLEEDAPTFAGWIVDPRKALLHQTAACAAAGEFGLELGQWRHGSGGSSLRSHPLGTQRGLHASGAAKLAGISWS